MLNSIKSKLSSISLPKVSAPSAATQDEIKQFIVVAVIVGTILGVSGTYVFSLATGALLVAPTVALYGGVMVAAHMAVSAVREAREPKDPKWVFEFGHKMRDVTPT